MKKKLGVALLLSLVMVLFCSCKDETSEPDYDGLIGEAREEITILNAKITQLEESLTEVTSRLDTMNKENVGSNQVASPAPTSNPGTALLPDDYHTYEEQIDQLKSAIQKNKNKENETFHEFKRALISLDNQLDLCEEQLESEYESNNLTWEQYKKRNNELDAIEATLDQAEDLLEKQFQVKDID